MAEGKFSAEELAARLAGLSRDDRVVIIKHYLAELRSERQRIGKRFDFFQAEGRAGEAVFYGPGGMPGRSATVTKNVIVVDSLGKVYQMTLEGLTPVDLSRSVPLVDIDLQVGQADLVAD